jgi:hypothetical protein
MQNPRRAPQACILVLCCFHVEGPSPGRACAQTKPRLLAHGFERGHALVWVCRVKWRLCWRDSPVLLWKYGSSVRNRCVWSLYMVFVSRSVFYVSHIGPLQVYCPIVSSMALKYFKHTSTHRVLLLKTNLKLRPSHLRSGRVFPPSLPSFLFFLTPLSPSVSCAGLLRASALSAPPRRRQQWLDEYECGLG